MALVTGAGSGIGAALAQTLSKAGYTTIFSDLDPDSARESAQTMEAKGLDAMALQLDITNDQQITDAVAQISRRFGRLDILINNAGMQHVASLENFPPERWRMLIDVLLTGPAMLCRAALPFMREQNYGRIINIGSIHSLIASPYKSAYVTAKHGLLGFSKTLALETAAADITINTVCPSYVQTPLVERQIGNLALENQISEEQVVEEIMLAPMPKKAFIAVDELSGAMMFLLSPAAKHLTGQAIAIDGGWTAQ